MLHYSACGFNCSNNAHLFNCMLAANYTPSRV